MSHEGVQDVLREMAAIHFHSEVYGETVQDFAHRIEAAHAREVEALRLRAEAAEAAGRRVIAAFEAHGKAKGVVDDLSTRAECERAMVALDAAISAEREG